MRILICPLNWGLGHASRDVLLIEKLLEAGHEVILAGEGMPIKFLKTEFPELDCIHLPQIVRITYFKYLPAWLKICLLSPFLLYEIIIEHFRLRKIIQQNQPDLVISDNRYGLWSPTTKSILITHQCLIRLPGLFRLMEYPVARIGRLLIEKFDCCWIPDYPGKQNLSGDLTHRCSLPSNAVFIGPLSRFSKPGLPLSEHDIPHYLSQFVSSDPLLLIMLSGPEPQRTKLEQILLEQIPDVLVTTVILQGLPGTEEWKKIGPKHILVSHLPSQAMNQLIKKAGYIICRSGYTSIMDLVKMQKKALIIPTPGQTEQEYLADYLKDKGTFLSSKQQHIDLPNAIFMLEKFEPTFSFPDEDHFRKKLEDL